MIDEYIATIWPLSPDKVQSVKDRALEDDHALFNPTEVIIKNGETIGALEINSSGLLLWWMHRNKSNIRDSVAAWQFVENIQRREGKKHLVIPCPRESAFCRLLRNPSAGYVELPNYTVFIKGMELK
jgi:trehalose utilization protein